MTEYIKRKDALKMCSGEIQDIRYMTDVFGKRYECVVGARRINADEIAEQIKKIPSADVVERKRGEWYDRGSLSCRCSNCRCKSPEEFSFCPNCGADMRENKSKEV